MVTLDQQQQEAVDTITSCFVTAGPGSGKTRVLVSRIINLVENHGASPKEILAFTFTKAAAKEMRTRLTEALGETVASQLWITTIHAFCVRVLYTWYFKAGLKENFSVYDDRDLMDIIKAVHQDLHIKTKPKTFLNEFHRGTVPESRARVLREVMIRLRKNNAVTYDMLLSKTIELFTKHPESVKYYANMFRYVHLDEMNDTSQEDYSIAKMVADQHKNVFAVGDIDQTIFGFRGAEIRNIERLKMAFPKHKDVILNTTYRCPTVVADACNRLIANNVYNRSAKTLVSTKTDGNLAIRVFDDEDEEAAGIATKIKGLSAKGVPFKDIAVLCRTHAVESHIAQNLSSQHIPVVIAGTRLKFLDLEEVRLFHSLLKLARNPLDELPFEQVMRMPHLGLSRSKIATIKARAASANITLLESTLLYYRERTLKDTQWLLDIKKLHDASFEDQVLIAHKWLDDVYEAEGLESRCKSLWDLLYFIGEWRAGSTDEITLENYLEHLHEVTSQDDIHEDEDSVRMMTVHASKGLEFPVVFIPALENLMFPLNNMADTDEKRDLVEEERRLLYVGMSRSMGDLVLSHVRKRLYRGKDRMMERSVFLEELHE